MVLSWIDHHRSTLGLTVRQCTELTSLMPGTFDFRVTLRVADGVCHGAGTGPSREQALRIAATEACERAILRTHGADLALLASAADTNPAVARSRAVREWYERTSFHYHFDGAIPGRIWSDDDKRTTCSQRSSLVVERIHNAGDRLTIMDLLSPQGICIVLAFVEFSTRNQGRAVAMGLGSKSDRSCSADHALIELIRNYLAATQLEAMNPTSQQDAVITESRQVERFAALAAPAHLAQTRSIDWQRPTIVTIDNLAGLFASSPLTVVGAKA